MDTDLKALRDKLDASIGCGRTVGHGETCTKGWECDGCSRLQEAVTALDGIIAQNQELLEASREELIRSGLTSLPLKLKFAEQRGLYGDNWQATQANIHKWMIDTRNRFEKAVKALTPET